MNSKINIKIPRWSIWIVVIISLVFMYGPSLMRHIQMSSEVFPDDVCQHISPFLRTLSDSPRDYIENYWRACLPVGYKTIYLVGKQFVPVKSISRFLPYILLLLTASLLATSAYRFGGAGAAWTAAVLFLSSDFMFSRMTGGLPRSFAFPLLACGITAVIYGRPYLLGVAVILAASIYPAIAVVMGIALALLLIMMPRRDQGHATLWSYKKRIIVIGATAGLCVLVTLPVLITVHPYGPPIGKHDLNEYPEAAAGGRLHGKDRVDFDAPLSKCIVTCGMVSLRNKGKAWSQVARKNFNISYTAGTAFWTLSILIIMGMIGSVLVSAIGRRLLLFSLAMPIAYYLSRLFSPYLFLPDRHISYIIPLLFVLWLSVAGQGIVNLITIIIKRTLKLPQVTRIGTTLCFLIGIACAFMYGGTIHSSTGLTARINNTQQPYAFIETLPNDSFIAGWPNLMSPVSYICGKATMVNDETLLPYHRAYTDEMRHRMRMLIDATFAHDSLPLIALRDEMGVTHLVIDSNSLHDRPGRYFKPFDTWIKDARYKADNRPFEVEKQRKHAEVFNDGSLFILDLSLMQEK